MSTATLIGPGDTVRVKNTGETTAFFAWNSRDYSIPPGKSRNMPFECMAVMCGDPRSAESWQRRTLEDGTTQDIPPRKWEVARLRTTHGGSGTMVGLDLLPNRPYVEVYDEDDNRIMTVLDDPDGEHILPIVQTAAEAYDQARTIQGLQARLTAVEARTQLDNEPGLDDAQLVEADD